MAWRRIEPIRGKVVGHRATLAWRKEGPGKIALILSKPLAQAMRLPDKGSTRALVDVDDEGPAWRLRVTLARAPTSEKTFAVSSKNGGGTLMLVWPLTLSDPRKAEEVQHELDADGALIITLPPWAKPASARKPIVQTEADVLAELREDLATGRNVRDVANDFGMEVSVVSAIAAEMTQAGERRAA